MSSAGGGPIDDRSEPPTTAIDRWREGRRALAIPEPILAAAAEDPWALQPGMLASRTDWVVTANTPSAKIAQEALPLDGTVLDVGCGPGAASLPLAPSAGRITGVDTAPEMLDAFNERMRGAGVVHDTVLGSWPEVSPRAPVADVVVCHHVLHNVVELADFALALTRHGGDRVVVEMTADYPLLWMRDLWRRFHGLERPAGPSAGDAMEVLVEAGLNPQRIDWSPDASAPWASFPDREALVRMTRRRLCLPAERDAEISEALDAIVAPGSEGLRLPGQDLVTLWWDTEG